LTANPHGTPPAGHPDCTLVSLCCDGNGRICGYGRDDIAYRQFGRLESCRVMKLERLTDERLAALLEKKTAKPRKVVIQWPPGQAARPGRATIDGRRR